jgi:sugar phosphate isomerase/epimerase
VKKIGYDAVELAGLGPIEPAELNKILTGEGFICCSTHTAINAIRNTQQTIENHKLWKAQYVIIPSASANSAQGWIDLANQCNDLAKPLAEAGLTLGYHNHSAEFVHYDGKPAIQILLEHISPQVALELDLHWVVRGGGDPVQWIEKAGSHAAALHMKDMIVGTDGRAPQFAEVGEGNLNWSAILAAAKKVGVKWYIVEQDDTYGKDAFECIERSLKNMKGMGLS